MLAFAGFRGFRCAAALCVLIVLAFAPPTDAQSERLLLDLRVGMTPAEVQKLAPGAEPPDKPSNWPGGVTSDLQMPAFEYLGGRFHVSFLFHNGGLVQVHLRSEKDPSFEEALRAARIAEAQLTRQFGPPVQPLEIRRDSAATSAEALWRDGRIDVKLWVHDLLNKGKAATRINYVFPFRRMAVEEGVQRAYAMLASDKYPDGRPKSEAHLKQGILGKNLLHAAFLLERTPQGELHFGRIEKSRSYNAVLEEINRAWAEGKEPPLTQIVFRHLDALASKLDLKGFRADMPETQQVSFLRQAIDNRVERERRWREFISFTALSLRDGRLVAKPIRDDPTYYFLTAEPWKTDGKVTGAALQEVLQVEACWKREQRRGPCMPGFSEAVNKLFASP